MGGASKNRRRALGAVAAVAAAAVAFAIAIPFANAANVEWSKKVDPDTTNTWQDHTAPGGVTSTQNVGRIWTDKTVLDADYHFEGQEPNPADVAKGNADFLVGLSALSSTSNLKSTTYTTVPLDIVMVLDNSESMAESAGNGQSRFDVLQEAAGSFVDSLSEVSTPNAVHRISVVGFTANSQNEDARVTYNSGWTDCDAEHLDAARQAVSNMKLQDSGHSNYSAGMRAANELMDSARQDSIKIVIVFGDGDPTGGAPIPGVSDKNFNWALDQAHTLKQDGAKVYTLGVFDGANAENPPVYEGRLNNTFMQILSSNYPDATNIDNGWGERVSEDEQYYYASQDYGDLNGMFDDIFQDVTTNVGSGSPIEENHPSGNTEPGTLIFTDQLGSYMQVSGIGAGNVMQLAYADHLYTSEPKQTSGNTDTYVFKGNVEGNAIYGSANLEDLKVTVTHGEDLATGDTVRVELPASLLPMRHYNVDSDNSSMVVTPAYPVRLFYGVSLKQEAKDALAAGHGDVYNAIVTSNRTDDGSIAFYSNLYNPATGNTGDTTATFTPNAGNKFYYYTSNTQLYLDEGCTRPATRSNIGNASTLYYSEPYWVQDGTDGAAHEVTTGTAISADGQDWKSIQADRNGNLYIPAGTQRLDRPATLDLLKERNETGTTDSVLHPQWEGEGVAQHLGNNGVMTSPLAGQLEIKKSVDWGNASDDTKNNQNSFEFTVDFNGDQTLEGSYTYDIFESGDQPVSSGTVTDGGSITLKADQRALISGLPAGTTFTVTESGANQNGFTTTDQGGADSNTTDGIVSGVIAGGGQVSTAFQNNYKADEPLTVNTADYLNVQKVLEGRDWRDNDSFTFEVQSVDLGSGNPQPENTTVTIDRTTADHKASFGDVTFDTTGTFRFVVNELNDTNPIAGINYSSASYRLTVTIADAGNGTLKVESYKLEQLQNDEGTFLPEEQQPVSGNTVTFTNVYSEEGFINIDGTKNYTDESGDNPIDNGKFTFQMEALGGFVTNDGSRDELTISADDTPKPATGTEGNVTTVGNEAGQFHMPTIAFYDSNVGNTYVYRITEVKGSEANMTYDETSYEVQVAVTEEPEPGAEDGHMHIVATADKAPEALKFTNTYDPEDAILGEDGTAAIHGTKTLTGRNMKDGEQFYFQLSAANDEAKTVLPEAKTVAVGKEAMSGGSADFDFGQMTFSKVGTYTFKVDEVAEDGSQPANGDGMTYDTNVCTVTVSVTLNKETGKLEAAVSYRNDSNDTTDKAQFTNAYEASMNYGAEGAGGINVTKTMVDRSMSQNDFLFTITGEGDAADKLGQDDQEFGNPPRGANQEASMAKLQGLTFDQADAGKTYTFTVDEAMPENDAKIAGVTYDQSEYKVEIQVVDNGDGTMHTLTTVTKTKAADGTEANEVVVDAVNSDDDGYKAPSFGFTNTYNPTGATLTGDSALKVTKQVTGAPSPDGVSYGFTLTAQDTAEGPIANIEGLADGKLTAQTDGVIDAGGTQTVTFGDLTFSKVGTYTFTVAEDAPEVRPGWTYDTAARTITVTVTDRDENGQYDGALHIGEVTGNNPTVTNSYKAGSVVLGDDSAIKVQKTVSGLPEDGAADTDFTFDLAQGEATNGGSWDRVTMPENSSVTMSDPFNAGNEFTQTASFGGITFDQAGTYTFKVTEDQAHDGQADPAGWTYDTHEALVTVTVTDDGFDGKLDATVTYDNSGAASDADKGETSIAAFTNSYKPVSTTVAGADFGLVKQLVGRPGNMWLGSDSFDFTLTAQDGAPMPEDSVDGSKTVTVKADPELGDGKASINFGNIEYTAAGTYTYTVTEAKGDIAGVTYDARSVTVTVTVTDADGQLTAKVTKSGEVGNGVSFQNVYEPGEGEMAINADKTLTGRDMKAGEFTFTVTKKDGSEVASGTNGDAKDGEASAIDFERVAYTKESLEADVNAKNAERTYGEGDGTTTYTLTYTVTEDTSGFEVNGVQADGDTSYEVTVTVTDNAEGKYEISVAYPDGVTDNTLHFNNKYVGNPAASGEDDEVTIQGTKELKAEDGSGLTAPELKDGMFSFEITGKRVDAEGNDAQGNVPMPAETTATNKADGTVSFGSIEYTVENVWGTAQTRAVGGDPRDAYFEYTITEENGGQTVDGITYDKSSKTVKVHVHDDGHGKITAEVTEGNDFTFTNVYSAGDATLTGGEAIFNGSKTLYGRNWLKGESFEFTMTPDQGDWGSVTYKAADDAEGEAVRAVTTSVSGDYQEEQKVAFNFPGTFIFSKPGTYTFNVAETGRNGEALPEDGTNGMDFDRHIGVITVEVKDNGKGGLEATATPGTGEQSVDFENGYQARPIVYGNGETLLGGHKFIDDNTGSYQLEANTFNFVMRSQRAGNPMPDGLKVTQDPQGRDIVTVKNAEENGSVYDFGQITFEQGDMAGATDNGDGTLTKYFQYNIFEGDTSLPGITKDNSAYTVTFTVTEDQNKGELSITGASAKKITSGSGENVPVDMTELDFTNVYNASEISGYQNIFKTLEGRNWQEEDHYTFNINMTATELDGETPLTEGLPTVDGTEAGGTLSEVTPNEDGDGFSYTVTIDMSTSETGNTYRFNTGELTYTHVGIYTYTISESPSEVAHVTSDATVYTVTVKVTDEDGALKREATVTPAPAAEGTLDFTNVYEPGASEGVPTGFQFTKTFTGRAWDGDEFEFVMSPVDSAPMPKADETAGVTIDESGNAHKIVSAPTGDSADTATFDFGAISYDKAGTYTYNVTEAHAGETINGITYDSHTAKVTVTVTDEDGTLKAAAGVEDGTFENAYHAGGNFDGAEGNGGLNITKQLNNRNMTAGQFSFAIEATGDNADEAAKKLGINEGTSTTVMNAEGAAGQAVEVAHNPFDTMSFDETDSGKTFTYTIKENGTSNEGDYKGYTLDSSVYTVAIAPVDNGDGTMTVTTSVSKDGGEATETTGTASVAFVNTYEADPGVIGGSGDAQIKATKTLKNDDLTDGQFQFQVTSGNTVVAIGTNKADGTINFGDITYTTEELAKAANGGSDTIGTATVDTTDNADVYTFNYTVSEVTDGLADKGITPSKSSFGMTVKVTDDRHGELSIDVSYDGGADGIEFVNTYGAGEEGTVPLTISGNKRIAGDADLEIPTLEGGEFTFEITGNAAEDGTPAPMPESATATNDATGSISFGDITYTMENVFGTDNAKTTDEVAEAEGDTAEPQTAGRTKIFTYSIEETGGKMDGVTNDTAPKTVEVTVTDLGDGKLSAEVTKAAEGADTGNSFTFVNTYDVKDHPSSPTGEGGFKVVKTLDNEVGRTMTEGEFSFELVDASGKVVAKGTNDAEGVVSISDVKFTEPGTYSYTLREVKGNEPGIDYDDAAYNVTAQVDDNGDGTLAVAWDVPQANEDNAVVFENTYNPAAGSITFGALKSLTGAELADGQFTFELTDPEGNVTTAVNDENGKIVFPTVSFDKPGTYEFKVAEQLPEDDDASKDGIQKDGVTYDEKVWTATVTVKDNTETGTLDATVSYGNDGKLAEFHNTYEEPATSGLPGGENGQGGLPTTGDYVPFVIGGIAVVAAGCIGGGVYLSKKRR